MIYTFTKCTFPVSFLTILYSFTSNTWIWDDEKRCTMNWLAQRLLTFSLYESVRNTFFLLLCEDVYFGGGWRRNNFHQVFICDSVIVPILAFNMATLFLFFPFILFFFFFYLSVLTLITLKENQTWWSNFLFTASLLFIYFLGITFELFFPFFYPFPCRELTPLLLSASSPS